MSTATIPHPFDLLLAIDQRSRQRARNVAYPAALQTINHLALRLQDWHLLFELDNVAELVSRLPITRIPSAKPWLIGIANLRGTVITVVDLAHFLGHKPIIKSKTNRIVVVRSGDWHYGLLVDEVIGMRHFDDMRKPPAAVPAGLEPYIKGAVSTQQHNWLLFDLLALLNNPLFLNAAA